jgi:hypothetical protein
MAGGEWLQAIYWQLALRLGGNPPRPPSGLHPAIPTPRDSPPGLARHKKLPDSSATCLDEGKAMSFPDLGNVTGGPPLG